MTETPEIELARRLSRGDKDALEEFTNLFQRKIFQYSYLMCGQRDDAEEVAQDTMLKVVQNYDQLREPEHVRSWVFHIAKNACLQKRRKSVFAPSEELPLEETLHVADEGPLPDLRAMAQQSVEQLREAIRDLPDSYRAVLLLRDLEELSTRDTAHVLGISEDLVKTRLYRARTALREKLVQR